MSEFTVQLSIFELYEPTKESAVYTNTHTHTQRKPGLEEALMT